MKILFNRPIKEQAWGGGSHFITSLYYYLVKKGIDVTFNFENNIDLIFMFEPRSDNNHPGIEQILEYQKYKKTPVIQRINDTDIARHAYGLSPHDPPWRIKTLLHANQFVDHTIFISEWVKNHYMGHGYNRKERKDSVIVNGCNLDYFYPEDTTDKKNTKLKVVTHHWSDNPMKGLDMYIAMDKICQNNNNIEFTYLGRYPSGYTPKATKIIPPVYGKKIGDILRAHNLYITGARFEACGMHHIEAASCGLPVIYHKDGGAINEVCKEYGFEINSVDDLLKALSFYSSKENRKTHIDNIDYDYLSNERCNFRYYECIISLINSFDDTCEEK